MRKSTSHIFSVLRSRSSLLKFLGICLVTYGCLKSQSKAFSDENISEFKSGEPFQPSRGGAILHMFDHSFIEIMRRLPEISSLGYDYIQISPAQLSRGDMEWWGRYQPLDYRIIDGPLGTEKDLKRLIDEAARAGVGIIADLVLNHAGNLGNNYHLTYPPKWVREKYKVGVLFDSSHFKDPFCITNFDDRYQLLNGRLCNLADPEDGGLPDYDIFQEYVFNVHKTYVKKLIDLGIAGFRIDALKHMEESYFPRLLSDFKDRNLLIFGEVIADRNSYDRNLGPYLRTTDMRLMDFPYQKTMVDAFKINADLRLLLSTNNSMRALPRDRSVEFVTNHDIPNNGGTFAHLILDPTDELLANIYMFARKGGIPHMYTDRGVVGRLKSDRWLEFYRKPLMKNALRFYTKVFKEGQTVVDASKCFIALKRGSKGLAAINKCGEQKEFILERSFSKDAKDLISGNVISAGLRNQTVKIPARGAVLYLVE